MVRVFYAAIALGGLAVVIGNRRFAASSHAASAKYFGRRVREGSAESRFMGAFSRVLAVVVGLVLFVGGTLAAFGLIEQE